jgi:hypothetical protein
VAEYRAGRRQMDSGERQGFVAFEVNVDQLAAAAAEDHPDIACVSETLRDLGKIKIEILPAAAACAFFSGRKRQHTPSAGAMLIPGEVARESGMMSPANPI